MRDQKHFNYNPASSASLHDQSAWFQKALSRKPSEVIKQKDRLGKTLTLTLSPTYFLAPTIDGFALFDTSLPASKPTLFTKDAWHEEHKFVKKTKTHYHPAYKNLCPVLRNAPKNPVVLGVGCKSEPAATYISKIVLAQLNDGTAVYEFETTHACIIDTNLSISAGKTYHLSFNDLPPHHWYYHPPFTRRDGTIKIDGEATTRVEDFIELVDLLGGQFFHKNGYSLHKAYVVIHRFLDTDMSYWLSCRSLGYEKRPLSELMRSWYEQLQANPELCDLPFNDIQLLALYNDARYGWTKTPELTDSLRFSIIALLRAGDTKSAIDACFFGYSYPKSIKRLMIKTGLLTYPRHVYAAIHRCVQAVGVDKTLLFITDVHNTGEPDLGIIDNVNLLKALSLGFNIDVIKQIQKRGVGKKINVLVSEKIKFIEDTVRMYERLTEANVPLEFPSKKINDVHNYLSNIHTFHVNVSSGSEMSAMKAVDTTNQSKIYRAGEYFIRSPFTAYELVKVGIEMSHCVSLYISRFYYRQIDIVLLVNSAGEYLACMELMGAYVTQAKLKHNKRLISNPEYFKVVRDYMRLNGLKPATLDLGEHDVLPDLSKHPLPPRDEGRIKAVGVLSFLDN